MALELAPGQVKKFAHDEYPDAGIEDYKSLGLSIAEDADVEAVLTQTGFTPLQYLQYPLNKPIEVLTTPVLIDKIVGRSIVADWETEEVIQPAIENAGTPRLYGDDSNTPFASMQYDFERRTVQRFELGCRLGKLEDARTSKMGVLGFKSPWDAKRGSVAKGFQLLMDEIGFRGFINGNGVTEGLLTDHNLLPYKTLMTGASGTTDWAGKTYEEICADIRDIFATLNDQTDTHFDGMAGDKCKLVLSPVARNALTHPNALGKTVQEWLTENYPGCETIAAPRFRNGVSGYVGCGMLIADELNGNEVVRQYIPTLMRLLGIEKRMKHVAEDYTFATAGVMVKQPLGIVTFVGC
jgi:hypothetical protein